VHVESVVPRIAPAASRGSQDPPELWGAGRVPRMEHTYTLHSHLYAREEFGDDSRP